jgi:hypothetical protein
MATTALAEPDHLARTATQALTNARRVGKLATAAGVDAHGRWMAALLHLGTWLFGAGLAPIHRPAMRHARRLARQV